MYSSYYWAWTISGDQNYVSSSWWDSTAHWLPWSSPVSMLMFLVILSTVLVTSHIKVCMTWAFHWTSLVLYTVAYPSRIPAHAWSTVIVSSSRLILSLWDSTYKVYSGPGGKGQLQGSPESQQGSGQSGFCSWWVTESGRREKIRYVSMEGDSQILKKTGKIDHLIRMDNLGKVTGSSLICRKEQNWFSQREWKSIKSPSDK